MESSLLLKNEVIEATANQPIYFSIFPYRYPDGSGRRRTKNVWLKTTFTTPSNGSTVGIVPSENK